MLRDHKMRETNAGLLSLPLSDGRSLSRLLFEAEGADLEQLLAMSSDNTDPQIFSWKDELLQDINNAFVSPSFEELSPAKIFQPVDDLSAGIANEIPTNKKTLSSNEIMKLARSQFMQASANGHLDQAAHFAIPARPREEQEGLELLHLLLASADMINNKKYDQAASLVKQCNNFSSQLGNPIQRLAYYSSKALEARIERETLGDLDKAPKPVPKFSFNIACDFDRNKFSGLVAFFTRLLPCIRVLQFTSTQAIIEAMGNAKKIHVIDLGMRTGSTWTSLIQSLALRAASSSSFTIDLLTITAVGMNDEELKQSGRRLYEFSQSLAVPFSYKVVEISSMEDIKEGLFDVNSGEAVAVNATIVLRSLLYNPMLLDNLMSVINKLRPRIVVNAEVEAQHNSPSFVNRFTEMLFYNTTYFDMLDVILPDRNDIKRVKIEEVFCGSKITNMIACEGKDRTVRHVKTDVWKCFFRQAGFMEMSFSYQAWYQARLLLNQFPHGECFTLHANGSAMLVGWKGTPLHAISAWTCTR